VPAPRDKAAPAARWAELAFPFQRASGLKPTSEVRVAEASLVVGEVIMQLFFREVPEAEGAFVRLEVTPGDNTFGERVLGRTLANPSAFVLLTKFLIQRLQHSTVRG
jgi:hypothetical protein